MAAGAVILNIAKWIAGIGAGVVAQNLLDDYYEKNKGSIGQTFEKWTEGIKDVLKWRFGPPTGLGKDLATLINKPTSENTSVTPSIGDKEQTNGLQGSMDYSEFNKWLQSAEGQKFLNETAPNLRGAVDPKDLNPSMQEQIEGIQGSYDAGEQYRWETSAAGQAWLEQAERIRLENEAKDKEGIAGGEKPPIEDEPNDDEEKEEFENPYQPDQGITDKTDENLGTNNIGAINWLEWAEQEQAKRWARDDANMKATWEREDNAWQRGVEDMKKAGVNPNLINAQPAASGGGITQSSGQNLSGVTSQLNIDAEKLQQMIDQAFKGNENDKDRFIETFGSIIQWIAILSALKK